MLNKCQFIGRAGADPDCKMTRGGDPIANINLAVNSKWKAKSGEMKEHTEWVRVAAFGQPAEFARQYVQKGSLLYIEGTMRTRSYEQDGVTKWVTEIVVQGPKSELRKLDAPQTSTDREVGNVDVDDEIPF